MMVTFDTPKTDPLRSLQIKIEFNGRVIHELERVNVAEPPETETDRLLYGAVIALSPFSAKEKGILNVIAVIDREEIACNRRRIVFSRPQFSTLTGSIPGQ